MRMNKCLDEYNISNNDNDYDNDDRMIKYIKMQLIITIYVPPSRTLVVN